MRTQSRQCGTNWELPTLLVIGGSAVETETNFSVKSPGDLDRRVGTFAAGDGDDIDRAVSVAAEAFESWWKTSVSDRVAIFRNAADIMSDRKYELAATLMLEAGKNRTEAMANIDEGIDFLRFYAAEFERHDGYTIETGEPTPGQHCTNHLEPSSATSAGNSSGVSEPAVPQPFGASPR